MAATKTITPIVPPKGLKTIVAPKIHQNTETVAQIQAYVDAEALKFDISTSTVNYIVSHESVWVVNPKLNDVAVCKNHLSSNYGKMTASRGLWQINDCYNPQVPIVCALSVPCSTLWSLTAIKAGHISWWSSWVWHLKHPNL
jgi:hypothetical protein